MPRLPLGFTQDTLNPQQQPRPVVQVPIARTPLVSPQGASATAEGAAAFGAGLARGGMLVVQGQMIQARRQRAQDVLDSETALQTYRADLDKWFDAYRQEGDPRTTPEQLELRGKDLMFTHGEPLTQGARQRFGIEAQQYLNVLLPKARDFRHQATEVQRQTVLMQAIDGHTRGIVGATDPQERAYHREHLQNLATDFETALLLGPEKTAALVQTAEDAATVATVRRQTQLDPEAMLTTLTEQAQQGVQEIGGVAISQLIDEAEAESDEAVRRENAREARIARQMDRQHGLNEGDLLNRIVEAQTLEAVDLLKHEVQVRGLDRTSQGLSEDGHRRLLSAVLAQETALTTPRDESDPLALREWQTILHVDRGRRPPADIRVLQAQVMADPLLKPGDANTIAKDLGQELDDAHYSKLPDYSSVRSTMLEAFRTTNPFDPFDEDGQRARLFALEFFNRQVSGVVQTQGPVAANGALFQIAEEAQQRFSSRILDSIKRRLHIPPSVPPGIFDRPVNLDSMTTEDSQRRYLEALDRLEQGWRDGRYTFTELTTYGWQIKQRQSWEQRVLRDRGAQTARPQAGGGSSRLERARRDALERTRELSQDLQQEQ